ncbi:SIS domain-containing protein [Acrocarpospora macrocephala]|uniref:Phosphoheptose isomerase n=1 Tax=Acrocarpospora macrocephala TaxID=150177 RepID=A0A5M3X303_9ACTN|nr:SIS domain-containing protein [Acrocarpospora macrocephala]GES14469.1 phosphoheptose isomerase [Acrocarpospora macrocephala]
MPKDIVEQYLAELYAATAAVDHAQLNGIADVLMRAWETGATIYTLGNGGSASLASHLACDLAKNTSPDLGTGPSVPGARRLRVVALADNSALLTALGNDIDFADIYMEQLKIVLTARDTVLAISGSGASPNVLRAMRYARLLGATTIAFTSTRATARQMLDLADHALLAPVEVMEQIEDLHVIYNHVLATVLRERIAQRVA